MSDILCGLLVLSRALVTDEHHKLCRSIALKALEHRMAAHLQYGIAQPLVAEIVDGHDAMSTTAIPFLLTRSPCTNYSDDLIGLGHFGAGHDPFADLATALHSIQSFFAEVLALGVELIAAYFSSAYEPEYEVDEVHVTEFAATMLARYRNALDVPNVCVHVRE